MKLFLQKLTEKLGHIGRTSFNWVFFWPALLIYHINYDIDYGGSSVLIGVPLTIAWCIFLAYQFGVYVCTLLW